MALCRAPEPNGGAPCTLEAGNHYEHQNLDRQYWPNEGFIPNPAYRARQDVKRAVIVANRPKRNLGAHPVL